MKLLKDLGQKDYGTYKKRMGIYLCSCGEEFECMQGSVKSGKTSRCKKCQSIDKSNRLLGEGNPMYGSLVNVKHGGKIGGKPTKLYSVWQNMKIRCYNEKSVMYYRYGGRGISICDEWINNFSSFQEWSESNGYSEYLEIDRKDNDGNYEPSNCRYVTSRDNSNNQGKSIVNRYTKEELLSIVRQYNETKVTIKELSLMYGMSVSSVSRIIKRSKA